jgi:hypothetical protein
MRLFKSLESLVFNTLNKELMLKSATPMKFIKDKMFGKKRPRPNLPNNRDKLSPKERELEGGFIS